ncbi:MAG: hypothetical protein KF897_09515 [Opitutaceae bacterium]|nr:hypothetical protein [Opitutaceae bacterium]
MHLRHLIVAFFSLVLISTVCAKDWKTTAALLDEVRQRWPDEKEFIAAPVRIDGAGAIPITEQAATLAKLLAQAKEKKVCVAVFGPPSAAARQVVLEALRLDASPELKGLLLVFCGAPADREAVEKQIVAKGATFCFIEFNE